MYDRTEGSVGVAFSSLEPEASRTSSDATCACTSPPPAIEAMMLPDAM